MIGWLYVADVQSEYSEEFSVGESLLSEPLIAAETEEETKEDVIHVVGLIEVAKTKIYLFQDSDGFPINPEWEGYKVRPINRCKVALIRYGKAIYAKCPSSAVGLMAVAEDGHLIGAQQSKNNTAEHDSPETREASDS